MLNAIQNADGTLTLNLPRPSDHRMIRAKSWAFYMMALLIARFAYGNLSPFPNTKPFYGIKTKVARAGILFASFSDWGETHVLELVFGKTAWAPGTSYLYMALCTAAVSDASTGASITEATYTGYARANVLGSSMGAASSPGGTIANTTAITFAACTNGTSTITYFALCDNSTTGAGNSVMWGTVTSKVIDTSNTPPTVAIGALQGTLD